MRWGMLILALVLAGCVSQVNIEKNNTPNNTPAEVPAVKVQQNTTAQTIKYLNLNLKTQEGGKYRYMSNPKKSMAVLVTMDSHGNQDRQSMFNNRDLKIILRPKLFLQTGENRMILYGEKGSTYKLADVKIG